MLSGLLQMALSTDFTTLGVLYEEPGQQSEQEDVIILQRLKKLAKESLPNGWLDWKISKNLNIQIEPQILNKVRFALPTIGIAKAFNPNVNSLKEKQYRNYKFKMLQWDFCKGLIISPSALALQIRGSDLQCQLVLQSIGTLKPHLLSRKEADHQLAGTESEEGSDVQSDSSKFSKRKSSKDRLDALESKFEKSEEILQAILEKLSNKDKEAGFAEEEDEEVEEDEEDVSYSSEGFGENQNSNYGHYGEVESVSSWKPPDFNLPSTSTGAKPSFDFSPVTREQEPIIPEPEPNIKAQGLDCQRLGSSSWNRIRYIEVQKKLQASPVFSQLLTNHGLNSQTTPYSEFLAKSDSTFGTLCHGLLKQRQCFQTAILEIISKHPESAETVKAMFGETQSEFRIISDDLLQLVCGKRAEVLDLRRKFHGNVNQALSPLLQKIPPSATHLFEEEKFELFRKEQGLRSQAVKRRFPQHFQASEDHRYKRLAKIPKYSLNSRQNATKDKVGRPVTRPPKDQSFRYSGRKTTSSTSRKSRF